MSNHEESFWSAVDRVREARPGVRREAYGFLMAALATTVEALPAARRADPVRRHLSAAELVAGMIDLARREFGDLAGTVFAEWGVRSAGDVGHMVFDLVAAQQLSARPEDRFEDFLGAPDPVTALVPPPSPRAAGAGGSAGGPGSPRP